MTTRVAINGFGRIGRNFLRACFEQRETRASAPAFQVVAINDTGSVEALAHLLKFDTTHGPFGSPVSISEDGSCLQVGDDEIAISHEAEPENCPWQKRNIDLVLESSGQFRSRADAAKHLQAGAKKVVIAAVAFDEVDATIVSGVNDHILTGEERIISAASCTTHCISPVLSLIEDCYGIENVFMTEMHAYTSDQCILDHVHRDLRRARSGAQNMIPTTSSSVSAVQKVLPFLQGRISGYSMRVPINNVAAVDLCLSLKRAADTEALHEKVRNYPDKNLIACSELPLVSSDFNHRPEAAIFDATQTQVLGKSIKVLVWYDNEWAYVNRLLDLLTKL